MSYYCRKCGATLLRRNAPSGRFDIDSGKPLEHQWDVCPNWRPNWPWGANGHDWRYLNENRIDGKGYPDPGAMQNPPRPPVSA